MATTLRRTMTLLGILATQSVSKQTVRSLFTTHLMSEPMCGCTVALVSLPPHSKQDTCVDYRSSEHSVSGVSEEELEYIYAQASGSRKRINQFIGGRIAMRAAIRTLRPELVIDSILPDAHGAPALPSSARVLCSVSHKDQLAIAAAREASDEQDRGEIGVDIELRSNKSARLLRVKLLTPDEQIRLGGLSGVQEDEETLLRFSFKESVYKAMHPYLLRPIGFHEVEVDPKDDGSAALTFRLSTDDAFRYEARWTCYDGHWVTCVFMARLS